MVQLVYSVYDLKTEVWMPPTVFVNEGHARREMGRFLRRGGQMAEFPDDYELCQIGTFDDSCGRMEALPVPKLVCRLKELMPSSTDETMEIPFGKDPTGRTDENTGKGLPRRSGKEKRA